MNYVNSGEKRVNMSFARGGSIIRPPISMDSTRPDLSVWESEQKTAYGQRPDIYGLTANTAAAVTQITPEILSINWKIWPPDMNYVHKEVTLKYSSSILVAICAEY
jgi:hypothetical protein